MAKARRMLGRRGDALRSAVLNATIDALTKHGIDAMSVGAVAAAAGVHETSIYRRWKTREALVLDALLDRSAAAIPLPDTGSLRDDLVLVLRAIIAYLRSPGGAALARAGVVLSEPDHVTARQAFWTQRLDALEPLVTRGIARGELPPSTDPRLLLEVLIAPLHARLLVTGRRLEDDLADRLVTLVLDGASVDR